MDTTYQQDRALGHAENVDVTIINRAALDGRNHLQQSHARQNHLQSGLHVCKVRCGTGVYGQVVNRHELGAELPHTIAHTARTDYYTASEDNMH